MCELKKICSKKDCHLVGIEQDICNFYYSDKNNNFLKSCKNCYSENSKKNGAKNKKKSNRLNIPILIKICSNKDCQEVSGWQIIHPDNKLSDFGWSAYGNKYIARCKICVKKQRHTYYEKNQDEIKENREKYYNENKIQVLVSQKEYYLANEEKIKLYQNNYRVEHKEETKIYDQIYYKENKEEIKDRNKNYIYNKRATDPAFKLKGTVSSLVRSSLKSRGISKNGEVCFHNLSYTRDELKEHIENLFEYWMNWDNWGMYDPEVWDDNDSTTWKWQLDHIIPHSTFNYTSLQDPLFKKCWALSNLRPLSAKQNLIDSNRRELINNNEKDK